MCFRLVESVNRSAQRDLLSGCYKKKSDRDFYPHAGLLLMVTSVQKVAARVIVLPTGIDVIAENRA
jgi:hypothetical protein